MTTKESEVDVSGRELLELAAKAAGLDSHRWTGNGMSLPIHPGQEVTGWVGREWNPLTDDGDALRLAVKLRLNIEHMETMNRKSHGINCWPVGRGDCGISETYISDYASATRRAIVRAAAAIAKEEKA